MESDFYGFLIICLLVVCLIILGSGKDRGNVIVLKKPNIPRPSPPKGQNGLSLKKLEEK